MADGVLLALNMRNLETMLNLFKKKKGPIGFSPQKSVFAKNQSRKMVFRQSSDDQVNEFQNLLFNNEWNGEIVFTGFKGTFKLQYWTTWQEILRNATQLRKISFVRTKLERQHLHLLGALISWLKPNEFSLKLKHNELDDEDLDELLLTQLMQNQGRNLLQFTCISNPGVFKGHFISRLRRRLIQMSMMDPEYEFRFFINESAKSLAFLRVSKHQIPGDLDTQLAKLEGDLACTYYFVLRLEKCFTVLNQDSVRSLIELTYNKDQLEQIEELDIGKCKVGVLPVFENMCKRISTSKGLLSLSLNEQKLIEDSQPLEALGGSRYGRLRLNHIDIGNNKDIVERCIKVLTDGKILTNAKTINFDGSMVQHLPVLVKLIYLIDAFKAEINHLRSKITNYIPKLSLRKLDLSTVDNYNRHDITEQLLLATVFNEFSGCRELTIQNVDVGRAKAYISAINKFESHIDNLRQHNPLYAAFRPKLTIVHMPNQAYRMEIDTQVLLLQKLFFTRTIDLLQITEVSLARCCRQQPREDGIKLFFEGLLHSNHDYTLKKLRLHNTSAEPDSIYDPMFKGVVFSHRFQLQELEFHQENLEDQVANFCEIGQNFLAHLPMGQFWSLQKLSFSDLEGTQVNIFQLLSVFVFTQKVRLTTLIFERFAVDPNDEDARKELVQKATLWDTPLSLDKLTFGEFAGTTLIRDTTIFDLLINHPMSRISELTLRRLIINESLSIQMIRVESFRKQGHTPLKWLKTLGFIGWSDIEQQPWLHAFDMLVFGRHTLLQSLHFSKMKITHALVSSFEASLEHRRQSLLGEIDVNFHLNELTLTECTFEGDILIPILTSHNCKLEKLHLVECEGVGAMLDRLRNHLGVDLINYLTSSLQEVVLDKSIIEQVDLFLWFMQTIIFNPKHQQCRKLSLKSCQLKCAHLGGLSEIFRELKQSKNAFVLRHLDFSDNPDIDQNHWSSLFEVLFQEVVKEFQLQIDEEEKSTHDINYAKQNAIESLCEESHQYVIEHRRFEGLPTYPPTQLKNVSLDLKYDQEPVEVKRRLYARIVSGLIMFPRSSVEKVVLQNVNLDILMSILKAPADPHPLRRLEICVAQHQNPESLDKLIRFVIGGVNLHHLKLDRVEGNLLQMMTISLELNAIRAGSLRVVHLEKVGGKLIGNEFFRLLQCLLFNQQIPLKEFELGTAEVTEGDGLEQLSGSESAVEEFTWRFKHGEVTTQTLRKLWPILIQVMQLRKLVLVSDSNECLDMMEGWGYAEKLVNFSITDLRLHLGLNITIHEFMFLYNVRPRLKHLELPKVNGVFNHYAEVMTFLQTQHIPLVLGGCELEIGFTEHEQSKLVAVLLFSEHFRWEHVKWTSVTAFEQVGKCNPNLTHLRYLNLSFGLLFNSVVQLNESALALLGSRLLYSEDSQLEQFCLEQCHLKPAGLLALTSAADNFRQHANRATLLPLKRFNLYYSLYIGEEGARAIADKILFFDYITIERFEVQVTNWNDEMSNSLCDAAMRWLRFQQVNERPNGHFRITYFDIGRNEFVQSQEAWYRLCDTFIFSDATPLMEVLNLHFMGIKDEQVEYICTKAREYFRWKPRDWVYPVKRLNFQLNTALSHVGWRRVCTDFFFAQHVHLVELNFISTMLDSPEKLSAVAEPLVRRALTRPNRRVALHSLLTYNISLKQSYLPYMSPRPVDYQPITDQTLKIEQCQSLGLIDGVPESIGAQFTVIQKALYSSEDFIQMKWFTQLKTRFAEYHITFTDGYLAPMNRILEGHQCDRLVLSLATFDELATMFIYNRQEGTPYPYRMLFTDDALLFLRDSSIREIHVVSTNYKNSENVTQLHVLHFWELLQSRGTKLRRLYLEYCVDDGLVEEMFRRGYTERDVVSLIAMFPPTHLRLQDYLTVEALKAIYSLMWDNHQFTYAYVMYNRDIFLNVGVGYALREYVYRNGGQALQKQLYAFFNLFVSETQKYTYSEQIKALDQKLSGQHFNLLFYATIAFYVACIVAPLVLSGWSYLLIAAISLGIEAYLFTWVVGGVKEHWHQLLVGQIAKLDFFNDICFILATHHCQLATLSTVALVITLYNVVIYTVQLYRFRRRPHHSAINRLYAISVIGRNRALGDLLDSLSPFNVSTIPNTRVTRWLAPSVAGKSVSNSVLVIASVQYQGYFLKFAIEDVPQTILQMLFLVMVTDGGWSIYLTFLNSLFTLFVSFNKFMSLRPAYISQEDFDTLAKRQREGYLDRQLDLLQLESLNRQL